MANAVIGWVKENPVAAGAAAIGVVLVVMMFAGSGSQDTSSQGEGSAGIAAYYGAVANQAQAGAAVQIAEVQAAAGTNQALIAATYGLEKEKTWAQVETTANQNMTNIQNIAINSNEKVTMFQIETQHAISDNLVNLENSRLGSTERIAKINSKAGKPSLGQDIAGVVTSIGSAAKSIGSLFG